GRRLARGRVRRRRPLVHARRELAVVPCRALALGEVQRDALGRLLVDHRADLVGPRVGSDTAGVAAEDLAAQRGDLLGVAQDLDVALEHDAAQLVVGLARLDLQRRARIAL